jgi:hypothetical protein
MEKVIYSLWAQPGEDRDTFGKRLREEMAPRMLKLGARGLQLNIRDSEVAEPAQMDMDPIDLKMDAIAHVWVDSAVNELRQPYDALLKKYASRICGYLVSESLPYPNTEFPTKSGERTPGLAQTVFMKRPPRVGSEAWMDLWHGDQTRLAVELQNNFYYCQNVVVRSATVAAPPFDAIVEEVLHLEAMTDYACRFRGNNQAEREKNAAEFLENTALMVDVDKIVVMATSQYVFKQPSMA